MKIHLIKEYENADGETRVLVCFVKETEVLEGLASSKQFGTLVLKKGTALADAEKALDENKDYSDELMFIPAEDGFYRAVPRA